MDFGKFLLAAVAFTIISALVHSAGAFLDMGYYADPANYALWSKTMMMGPSPPGAEFYAASIVFSLIVGFIFAEAYVLTKNSLASKKSFSADKDFQLGLKFGTFLFLMTSLTGTMSMFLIFAAPFWLLISWLAQSLVISLASGVAFAKIIR